MRTATLLTSDHSPAGGNAVLMLNRKPGDRHGDAPNDASASPLASLTSRMSPAPIVRAERIERLDARTGRLLLHPADVVIEAGARIAVRGPSGSGKSVLLRTLAWLDAPDRGTVAWRGEPIRRSRPATIPAYRSAVAYLRQRPALLDGSVADNMRAPFSLRQHKHARYDAARVTEWLAVIGRGADFLERRASELSGGEAQIAALIRTLQLDPDVLLLDEPTAALDAEAAAALETLVAGWFGAAPDARAYAWVTHDAAQAERVGAQRWQVDAGVVRAVHVEHGDHGTSASSGAVRR
jgi:putative ABC transport system ATP-binding protein